MEQQRYVWISTQRFANSCCDLLEIPRRLSLVSCPRVWRWNGARGACGRHDQQARSHTLPTPETWLCCKATSLSKLVRCRLLTEAPLSRSDLVSCAISFKVPTLLRGLLFLRSLTTGSDGCCPLKVMTQSTDFCYRGTQYPQSLKPMPSFFRLIHPENFFPLYFCADVCSGRVFGGATLHVYGSIYIIFAFET